MSRKVRTENPLLLPWRIFTLPQNSTGQFMDPHLRECCRCIFFFYYIYKGFASRHRPQRTLACELDLGDDFDTKVTQQWDLMHARVKPTSTKKDVENEHRNHTRIKKTLRTRIETRRKQWEPILILKSLLGQRSIQIPSSKNKNNQTSKNHGKWCQSDAKVKT